MMPAPEDVTDTEGNVLERVQRNPDGTTDRYYANGDGTWQHMALGADGAMVSTGNVAELPEPATDAPDPGAVLTALISELAAISPTSTSAQVRTAIINARNAAAQAIAP